MRWTPRLVKQLRGKRTLAEFGALIGAPKNTVWRWEAGEAQPDATYAERLSELAEREHFLKDWKLEECITTTRTPIDPNGHEPSEEMPWRPIGRMDDDELAAVYEFLAHLPVLNMPAIYRATRLPCASRYRCYWT